MSRFALVAADGRELADHDELGRLLDGGGDQDPRNYPPTSVWSTGTTISCDCKDGRPG